MEIEITLKNYRCFPDSNPARITLREGFTSFVGVNNAGKSSLLKFFYELRPLFQFWTPNNHMLLQVLRGQPQRLRPRADRFRPGGIFSNTNTRDMEIEIKLLRAEATSK